MFVVEADAMCVEKQMRFALLDTSSASGATNRTLRVRDSINIGLFSFVDGIHIISDCSNFPYFGELTSIIRNNQHLTTFVNQTNTHGALFC